jgi:hypothetical protein
MKFPRSMHRSQHAPIATAIAFSAALLAQAPAHAQSSAPTTHPSLQIMGKQPSDIMRRDLGLDARSLSQYIETERRAIAEIPEIEARLGAAYAGSWIERGADGRHRLVVASTKPSNANFAGGKIQSDTTASG